MPVPGTNISQDNILGMLFKKHENVVNTNPLQSFKAEPLTNARPRVFPTEQLIAQEIPKNDISIPRNLIKDIAYIQKIAGGTATNIHAERHSSSAYPYIVFYKRIKLSHKVPGISYFYSSNDTTNFVAADNILTDTIPFTFDTNGTYAITIEFFTGDPTNPFAEIAPNNDMYPWILDTDGGVVTFYCNGTTCVTYPVYISFWRYEGAKGLIAASGSNKLEPSVILPNRNGFTFSNELGINNSAGNPDTITSAFAKMDDWFFTNMISQPPAPQKVGEYRKTTEVGVMFNGPQQLYLLDMYVPVIKNISTDIVITSQITSVLDKNTTFTPPTNKVDGIVISKLAGTSGTETRATTQGGRTIIYNVYVFYSPALATNPTFTLNIWYSNDSTYPVNKLSVPGLSFDIAYPPSEPTLNAPVTQSNTQINISWTQPEYIMYDQSTNTMILTISTTDPSIKDYLVTYTPSSTSRYPGIVNATQNTLNITSATQTPLTNLLPGTTYDINVKAVNTANANYGFPSVIKQGATDLPTQPPLLPLMTNPFTTSLTNGTISQVGSMISIDPTITPIFIEGETPISSLYYPIPIHTPQNAGSTVIGITTLELTNNTLSVSGTVDGFPAKPYTNITSSSLEMLNIQTYDFYNRNFPSMVSSSGFYLSAQAKFKLKNLPNASLSQQTLTIKSNNTPYSHKYHVEKNQGQPTLTFAPIQLPQTKLISGIPTIGSSATNKTITCHIDASNIGTYFYRRSGIFDISGTPYIIQHLQTTLPLSVTAPITAPVSFTTTLPLNITPTEYARGFTMKAKAHNGVISGVEQTVQVPILIDSASYNASFPSTPPDPTNGFVTGMRCVTAAPDLEPVPGTLEVTNTAYYDISNVLTSNDLPYLHGKYQVRDSQANTSTDFVDYRLYGGSDLTPLTTESGFRWITYAWKIPSTVNKSVNTLEFKIENFKNTIGIIYDNVSSVKIIDPINPSRHINNDVFKAYYRIIDVNNTNMTDLYTLSTIWMNLNNADTEQNRRYSTLKTDTNYNGNYGGLINISIPPQNTEGNILYKVFSPSFNNLSAEYIIMLRIGISMNAYGISFNNIQASYTLK